MIDSSKMSLFVFHEQNCSFGFEATSSKDLLVLFLQLMGSLVLAVGLWLRLDPNTVSLLGEDGPETFFIGKQSVDNIS